MIYSMTVLAIHGFNAGRANANLFDLYVADREAV